MKAGQKKLDAKVRMQRTGKLLGTPCLVHDALVQELEELLGRENVAVR